MRNTAEHESWGECVGEVVICNEQGWVGTGDRAFLCTGGHHVETGKFIRCVSTYHDQDGPMSPGIAFMATPDAEDRP